MNKEDLQNNLGTIAQSGSKAFVQQLSKKDVDTEQASQIIGQFGVGFYSVFMVADRVTVASRSCRDDGVGLLWESDGHGEYTITEAEGVTQGTKITLHLKDVEGNFAVERLVENIVKKYSNFINFPIFLNGNRINTVQALWKMSPKDITEEEHTDFFKFISKGISTAPPTFKLHYSTDHPLAVRALLYVPADHTEAMGMGKMDMNVHLYSRGVMIQQKSKALLPEWLRFLHGVVDSEEIPLNISRETAQDGMVLRNLKNILTRKVLRWLQDEQKKNPEKFLRFHSNFSTFFREGICTDVINKDSIAKLLRYESSMSTECDVSLEQYVERMKEGQNHIYYHIGPNRAACESSPYYEEFKRKGVEVIFSYSGIDQFAFDHLATFQKKSLKSIDAKDINLDAIPYADEDGEDITSNELSQKQCQELAGWLSETALKGKLIEAVASTRLASHPAVIVGSEQINAIKMQRMMGMMNQKTGMENVTQRFRLEFNPKHTIIQKLYAVAVGEAQDAEVAHLVTQQIFDNALAAAGLLEDPRSMLDRINLLMERSLSNVDSPKEAPTEAPKA
eukprot:NODE_434_length_1953_cov_66.047645_g427_i0.p1 GENE.NODE_434_length_1953_cov_66.047645_g427_i0~~NODE_434_length_1953_cov_66.047645_g427_i0.p1  ORF type:complete len:627 (-),score=212.92 NODE_434_length_1953_cov_66.047645_g427_i0:71-1759(-)